MCLCFLSCCVSFGLILFCSLCLLEWSRCCFCFVSSWYVLFVFVICLVVFVSLVSHENHRFPCNSSVFCLMLVQSLFLISVFGLFVISFKMFLWFFFVAWCLVLF